jgi:hypothetical protein
MTLDHVWFWRPRGDALADAAGLPRMEDRKGQPCRVVARGRMNSVLVELADGFRVITSRHAVRRAPGRAA